MVFGISLESPRKFLMSVGIGLLVAAFFLQITAVVPLVYEQIDTREQIYETEMTLIELEQENMTEIQEKKYNATKKLKDALNVDFDAFGTLARTNLNAAGVMYILGIIFLVLGLIIWMVERKGRITE